LASGISCSIHWNKHFENATLNNGEGWSLKSSGKEVKRDICPA